MSNGYFGIGIYNGKTLSNIGTLWRSAYQLGASFIFLIGGRYQKQCSDTVKAFRHIPLIQYKTYEDFQKSIFYDCELICIEFTQDSIRLNDFCHPKRCIYLLGAEDSGIPNYITENHKTIEIPCTRIQSFNVSIAGSIVMYDRLCKQEVSHVRNR